MSKLPLMVATGQVTTAQSKEIRSTLETLLRNLPTDSRKAGSAAMRSQSVRDALRASPDLLHLFAPLLSDEELLELVDDDQDSAAADEDRRRKGDAADGP